jgi:hypothetical protein
VWTRGQLHLVAARLNLQRGADGGAVWRWQEREAHEFIKEKFQPLLEQQKVRRQQLTCLARRACHQCPTLWH